ncbi:UDP-N-acetylglucosamine--N-acetylmuramyl-(pentapeptide) pyrophosphoryl-undecaprenol N-acetylglucosamine transferase [candidate division WWE3 bacterium]|uniref:UDP-N-acetylglucosamine--N-acetylmuramyl-(Pentapeptide) pyrophosphoryl-undecaprenol N-acetylglucosamine transferase n=1 Tax=candidate division WWE3 bacterium TaxID=2053526 RepID=A0A3A4ZG32_UNCKA|nr:MAG: UDP-N-acetylglucosamine--N-acetylmuramyl-(pentapeptide) pyrophosphoryl-undecaprenol N-acetylglucosamine transferase [candidate division WWE3 bacterium]
MKIVMTGGHHSSALPIIRELRKKDPDIKIYWFGHRHSMRGDRNDTLEYIEVTELGIPFFELKAGKFYKTFSVSHWIKIPLGFIQAFYLLMKIKPDLIFSFGGYLAVPVVVAGRALGIRSFTHEQTVVAGYANKLISLFSDKIFVSWKESVKYFPESKVVFSGLPLRESILYQNTSNFDLHNDMPTVLVIAGKTGSVKINNLIEENMERLLSRYNLIHQCGDHSEFKSYELLSNKYKKIQNKVYGNYFLRKFIFDNEIGEAYGKASVVVSRAGAHTVAELITLNKTCVLIPIPWVSHNEQYLNAKILEKKGIGVILEEDYLNGDTLLGAIESQLKKTNEDRHYSESVEKISTDPVQLLVDEILAYEKKKK